MDNIKKKIATTILTHLRVYEHFIQAFQEDRICVFEEPFGAGSYVDATLKQRIADIEKNGACSVYAVIRGEYQMSDSSIMAATTYLVITNEDVKAYEHNLKYGFPVLDGILSFNSVASGCRAFAFVDGTGGNYGYVHVEGCNGGIIRTA